jgi:CRP/FNR family cyclic AMP-dependent transcriptional regulator
MQDGLPTPLQSRRRHDPMPLIPHAEVIQERLDALPLVTVEAGGAVLLAGSRTDRLLFLKKGSVVVIKDGAEIARVTQPRAVFGELAVLLNQPHSADLRALETSQFHVADPEVLATDPFVLIYVSAVLARRLDAANRSLVELKMQLQDGQAGGAVAKAIENIERMLGPSHYTARALLTS